MQIWRWRDKNIFLMLRHQFCSLRWHVTHEQLHEPLAPGTLSGNVTTHLQSTRAYVSVCINMFVFSAFGWLYKCEGGETRSHWLTQPETSEVASGLCCWDNITAICAAMVTWFLQCSFKHMNRPCETAKAPDAPSIHPRCYIQLISKWLWPPH